MPLSAPTSAPSHQVAGCKARAPLSCRVPTRWRQQRRCPLLLQVPRSGASDALPVEGAGDWQSDAVNVFPRLREKDPFKLLGIPSDSDFEEVQQARNYLVQEHSEHEPSRERIELAYEQIVNQSFRARRKRGFRPGRGKRGERVRYEVPPGLWGRLTGLLDPSVTAAAAARDLAMFCALGAWSAVTLPVNAAALIIAFGYAVFRTSNKRKIRNPEGPYFGDSPVFGAVLLNAVALLAAGVAGGQIAAALPFWLWNINPLRASAFMQIALLCPLNIWLK